MTLPIEPTLESIKDEEHNPCAWCFRYEGGVSLDELVDYKRRLMCAGYRIHSFHIAAVDKCDSKEFPASVLSFYIAGVKII